MTFQCSIKCDFTGCNEKINVDCFDASNAEDDVFKKADESGWFVDAANCDHYCHKHAQVAKEELLGDNSQPSGIYSTMVG